MLTTILVRKSGQKIERSDDFKFSRSYSEFMGSILDEIIEFVVKLYVANVFSKG